MTFILALLVVAFQTNSGSSHDMIEVSLTSPASGAVSNMHTTSPSAIMPEVLTSETSGLDDDVDYAPPATPTLRIETVRHSSAANWMLLLSAGFVLMGLLGWQRVRRRMCAKS